MAQRSVPVLEARPGVGEIANSQAQCGLIARLAAPIPCGTIELREATGPHALTWNVT